MKEVLRKKSTIVGNITYESGDFSNNLHASNIAVEVIENRVVFSLDLSPSQPRGSSGCNSYLDVENLKRKFESLKFLQMGRDPWLEKGLRSAAEGVTRPASLEVEFTFKDGTVRTMPVTLKRGERCFWFYRNGAAIGAVPSTVSAASFGLRSPRKTFGSLQPVPRTSATWQPHSAPLPESQRPS